MNNRKIEIKWALVFILFSMAWVAGEMLAGFHSTRIAEQATYTMFFAIPAILIYVFALLNKRRRDYHGFMTYKQGFVSGLVITAIVTLFTPITQWIVFTFISPEYFTNIIRYSVEQKQMTELQAKDHFNLQNYMVISLIFSAVSGIITSALVALFVQRKPRKGSRQTEAEKTPQAAY